ncbi:molybdate-anion transporter-like [Adelges cooleyi]|uniref:molybdate-anion transporter-like n=1 Tax=Adelges cooleyi TaxID=133065 RepID=UPI0021802953|nr:molybdate-anion transporter-like [Adelges cooleyi]
MFGIAIAVLVAVTFVLFTVFKNSSVDKLRQETNSNFKKIQKRYLLIYCLAAFSDWLQGPYVYSLYKHFGYNEGQIAILFITGTLSSSLFGTITGALADIYGRKSLCTWYGILYTGCCVTKIFGNYQLLILGRILGGLSTSILFSAFESWYINEHINHYKLPNEWLNITFATTTFCNATLAILAGLISYVLVTVLEFGPVAPFIMAIPFLLTTSLLVRVFLHEHYKHNTKSASASLKQAVVLWLGNKHIFTLSMVQSLYEGVMYLFIFFWTPALDSIKPPLGLVFSSFMLALMIGSKLYSLIIEHRLLEPNGLLVLSTLLATVSFLICALAMSNVFVHHASNSVKVCYLLFLLFEISIGMYYPSMTYLKSQVIPEKVRVTISNVIKIPSNLFTCLALLWIRDNQQSIRTDFYIIFTVYLICFIATFVTFVSSKIFSVLYRKTYLEFEKRDELEI